MPRTSSCLQCLAAIVLLPVMTAGVRAEETRNECLICHERETPETYPASAMEHDVHLKEGLNCVGCHGGNPNTPDRELAKAAETGYVGKPEPSAIPRFCGKCHSDAAYMRGFNPGLAVDQEDKYATSRHGELLAEGAQDVATCVSCHGSHGMRTAKDPLSPVFPTNVPATCGTCHADPDHMAPYGIPTDQLEKYRASVHGIALLQDRDIGAPACNDCHGNHGAQPPDVSSINHVCGQCHAHNAELIRGSFHSAAVELFEEPECGVCHDHHGIVPPSYTQISMSEMGVCSKCHENDPEDPSVQLASTITAEREKLEDAMARASERLEAAQRKGMFVNDLLEYVEGMRAARFQTRTLTHAFDAAVYTEACAEGNTLAARVIDGADALLREFDKRRLGLAVSSCFFTLLALGLILKIRRIERSQSGASQRLRKGEKP